MAQRDNEKYAASASGDDHAQLLYKSLEDYNKDQKKRRRPSVILAALLCLFLSASGGIALAVVLLIQPIGIEAACLPRDLILFGSCMSLLYIGLHIRGARKDYIRNGPAPPQNYGNYLHASALLISRLSIAVWIAALVATAVIISKSLPFDGFGGKVPFLDLLICIGAIPSFIIISITIEKHTTPFATTAISRNSFLTCRVSDFADDLDADVSVSRRASLQRKQSQTGSILTLPTEDMFRLGISQPEELKRNRDAQGQTIVVNVEADDEAELMANSPIRASHNIPIVPGLHNPHAHSPPQPTYNPGGWRNEWDDAANQAGGVPVTSESTNSSSSSVDSPTPFSYSSHCSSASGAPPRSSNSSKGTFGGGGNKGGLGRRSRASASTSIASSSQRSNLSTVRYAAEPEVAIRQPIKVVRNPAYAPATATATAVATAAAAEVRVEDVQRPRSAAVASQRAHAAGPRPLRRNPSNFSRPIPPPYR
ncbi:hypothetical protein F5X99DRAFT_428795 [Biscogniauxia marginata]|nr:hypothetical protein F5X99DRAFT_428795 [Biscogniauxia marginata]